MIIGAGPAGLTCAYELLMTGDIRAVIVEKDAMVGGLSRTDEHKGDCQCAKDECADYKRHA